MINTHVSSSVKAIAGIFSSQKFALIFISIFTIILVLYCLKTHPIRQGDGYEYALILQSFFNHFTPDIREADITSLIKIVETHPSSYDVKVLQGTLSALRNGENEIYLGILKSIRGEYFGYHFWLYPLINLPAKALLAVVGMNELKAFQLTNGLLISCTLVYVLLFTQQSPFMRWAIALLYLTGCVFFYLRWPHPEVFIAASILICGCAFLERRIYIAAIAASLATLQNPSVVFLLATILIFFIVKNLSANILPNPIFFLKKHIGLVLIAALSLFPYAFYYYHYRILNLIAERGFVNPSLMSWGRFNSTIFDLNQGLIVGFPGVMLGLAILLIYRLILLILQQKQRVFNHTDLLLIAFLLILQPTLSQTNWNHGQEIFSRYAFWTGMILIVWVAGNMSELRGWLRYSLLTVMLALQFFPNELFFKHAWDGHYLKMKSQANWVLSNFPNWYNPEPEIFAERVRGYERFGEVIAPNQIESPFIYLDDHGNIRKILIYQDFASETQQRVCGNKGKLISNNAQDTIEKLLANITFNRQGWGYINGSFRCAIPLSIKFSENGNSADFMRQGWDNTAIGGSLIKSPEAILALPINNSKLQDVKLTAKIRNLSLNQAQSTNLQVLVNNQPINQWTLKAVNQAVEYQAIIPAKILAEKSPVFISFRLIDIPKQSHKSTNIKVLTISIDSDSIK